MVTNVFKISLLLFVCASITLEAQHSYTPADIAEGGRLFRANCVLCHGPEGDQVPGIDLGHPAEMQDGWGSGNRCES